jgi:hypothetical protein
VGEWGSGAIVLTAVCRFGLHISDLLSKIRYGSAGKLPKIGGSLAGFTPCRISAFRVTAG